MLNKKYFFVAVIAILMINAGFALANQVEFTVDVPNEDSMMVGVPFSITVMLDVPSAIPISAAEVLLLPTNDADLSLGSGSQAFSGTVTPISSSFKTFGWNYGETSTGDAISGDQISFVTFTVIAPNAGDVTFNFEKAEADDITHDVFNGVRTTTSTSKTVTINPACQPSCGVNECGDDGCGGSCGSCEDGSSCSDGSCVATCTDTCGDLDCGLKTICGLETNCGSCEDGLSCVANLCVCVPDCDGKECGDDGCGGSCGSCEGSLVCTGGLCKGETQHISVPLGNLVLKVGTTLQSDYSVPYSGYSYSASKLVQVTRIAKALREYHTEMVGCTGDSSCTTTPVDDALLMPLTEGIINILEPATTLNSVVYVNEPISSTVEIASALRTYYE